MSARKLGAEVEEGRVAELATCFPDAPPAELLRFVRARPESLDAALHMYRHHREWREDAGAPERLLAAAHAVPPKYVRPGGRARDGSPLVLVQGARFDHTVSAEQYVLACAEAIDATVSREEEGKITVLVDVRPGEGWPNAPAHKMMGFIQLLAAVLPNNFPERAQQVIVYPIPTLVKHLWFVARGFMDATTREKVILLSGKDGLHSPCPKELGQFVSLEELPMDAQARHASLAVA